jgi:DUF1680 family protein
MTAATEPIRAVGLRDVQITGGFWGDRLTTNRDATLPTVYYQSKITGRFDAWKLDWQPGQPNQPHIFWDSDGAKWIEAAAYSLTTHPDAALEAQADAVIDLIAAAQQPDGYLNVYFTVVEPEKRWTNLRDWHELYCAGHLIEAAVAYFQATGKRKLLDVLCRYADHIATVFGPGEGQKRGYPGHEEIELALIKLYRVTGEVRYLNLAKFFIDERGQQPHYYDLEAVARGESPDDYWAKTHRYTQSHIPVRQQTEPVGHAVRACYLYSGMADVALETDDDSLTAALRQIWDNLTGTQMYITGGIGPSALNEGFTFPYDLPNETAYAETCAAIALGFWAHRMAHLERDGRYTDVLERALYNGVISGVSFEGHHFFYANPLAAYPHVHPYNPRYSLAHPDYVHYRREEWFSCACCPPNLARVLAGLGQYFYAVAEDTLFVHLYGQSAAAVELGGQSVQVTQTTDYPWDGTITLKLALDQPAAFKLALRIPGWSRSSSLKVNGQPVQADIIKGYAYLTREWQPGDTVTLELPMPVERVRSHPKVRENAGCIALQRGPLVYCLEEADNGPDLAHRVLPPDAQLTATFEADVLGGVVTISGQAQQIEPVGWDGSLYGVSAVQARPVPFKAIPYCFWANRQPGEMRVWIRER